MASVNRLKRAWAEGRPAFGLWSAIPDSFAIEQIFRADLDYAPVVRVPQNEPWMIMRALDECALGIMPTW
jgi:2-keto-3-deoxy-L-rhamnonate aldolase RhmA